MKKLRPRPLLTATGVSVLSTGLCLKAGKTAMQTILITTSAVTAAIATIVIASKIVNSAMKER